MISKGAEKEKYFVVKREASNRANAFLSRAQSSEILRGLRHYISKELYNQTPFQVASYAYVHKHPWICHRSKNKHQTPPSFSPLNPLALSSLLFSSLPFPSLPFPAPVPSTTHFSSCPQSHQAQYKRSRKNNNNTNNDNDNNNLCFFPRNRFQKKRE